MAEASKDALVSFDAFIGTWGAKYKKAAQCLARNRDVLLAFRDFPAEHWKHVRTSNVIKSAFATVRHRMIRSTGSLLNGTGLAMRFKLAEAAKKRWRRLTRHNQLLKIIHGVNFTDGQEVRTEAPATAA